MTERGQYLTFISSKLPVWAINGIETILQGLGFDNIISVKYWDSTYHTTGFESLKLSFHVYYPYTHVRKAKINILYLVYFYNLVYNLIIRIHLND